MRTTCIALASIGIAVVGVAAPAQAAPKESPSHLEAPYTNSYTATSKHCWPGTSCAPAATASEDTGRISATMDMRRATADEPRREDGYGVGLQFVDVRPLQDATKLTATFTWSVASSSTSAHADQGAIWASTGLYATASCGGCTASTASAIVASSYSGISPTGGPSGVTNVQKRLTVTVSDLPRNSSVRFYSGGSASTSMEPVPFCAGAPGCDALPPYQPGHAGTAHADLDAGLTSVDLSYS